MYVDSPSDHVFTLFDEMLYAGHPLGREIAGTIGSVRRATHRAVVDHWRSAVPDRRPWCWPSPAHRPRGGGRAPRRVATRRAGSTAPATPAGDLRATPPTPAPAGSMRVSYRRLSQGNLCLGMPGVARDDPDRWALDLLGAILATAWAAASSWSCASAARWSTTSRPSAPSYADVGSFGVHAGFDPEDAERVVRAIVEQLDRITTEPFVPRSSTGPGPTPGAGSSCGWRTRARSPAGSGRGRRSSRAS